MALPCTPLARVFAPGRPTGRLSCALLSGGLLALAGRPWGLGWLAWLALVPLLAALEREGRPLAAAGQAALVALAPAFVVYEAIGPFLPAGAAALAVAATLPFALAAMLAPRLRRLLGPAGLALAFPLLWVAAEALPGQDRLLGNFASPLFAVGYSQAGLPTMQLARLGGVEAVSLAVLAANALVATALQRRARWPILALAGLAAAVAATALTGPGGSLGALRSPRWRPGSAREAGAPPPARRDAITVRLVQEALPDAAYAAAAMLPEARDALVRRFVHDSLRPSGARAALTVWPEGALPGPLPVTGTTGLEPLLTGLGPTLAGAPARTADGIANAAFAWRAGTLRHVYDKRRLAPITEDGLVRGSRLGLTDLAGVRVAPLICFEAAFPGLARQAARNGAQLLAVLTNDAFGRFLGTPLQHLRVARFRAVETGLPLAFASNAGPSAVIDGRGRVLARTPAGRPATITATPRLATGPTPYLRWGDWPGTIALAGAALLALACGAIGGRARS